MTVYSLESEQLKFLRNAKMDSRTVNKLNHQGQFERFKKFIIACNSQKSSQTVGSIDCLSKDSSGKVKQILKSEIREDGEIEYGMAGLLAQSFLQLPFDSSKFSEVFDSLTFAELQELEDVRFPFGLSTEIFVDWIEHQLVSMRSKNSLKTLIESNELCHFAIDNCIETVESFESLSQLYADIMRIASKNSGYRSFAKKFIQHYASGLRTVSSLMGFNVTMEQPPQVEKQWIDDFRCADYVLSRIQKKFQVQEVIHLMNRVMESDVPLTTMQWLWVMENYDIVKDSPVSWWIAMAGE